jgi:hypothetical protein
MTKEDRKEAFIVEYADLCRRHGMMVVQVFDADKAPGGYSPYVVTETEHCPGALPSVLIEMRIEALRQLSQ